VTLVTGHYIGYSRIMTCFIESIFIYPEGG